MSRKRIKNEPKMKSKTFYITTTLPYVNAEPHVGFAMEIIRADVIARWKGRDPAENTDRKAKAFWVPVEQIRENEYDLSISRYKKVDVQPGEYEPPRELIAKLRETERQILADLESLEQMLTV